MKFISYTANAIISAADFINDSIGKTVAWLVVGMVVMTFGIVIMRYLFNMGSIQAQESVIYMHAIVFMLASATTLKQDGHVRVDIFYGKMGDKKKAIVNFLGNLFLLLPVCLFILWSSWGYVMDAWEIKETSREAGGLPGIYLLKLVIIIFAAMLILQSVSEMLKSLRTLLSSNLTADEKTNGTLNPVSNNTIAKK